MKGINLKQEAGMDAYPKTLSRESCASDAAAEGLVFSQKPLSSTARLDHTVRESGRNMKHVVGMRASAATLNQQRLRSDRGGSPVDALRMLKVLHFCCIFTAAESCPASGSFRNLFAQLKYLR